MAPILLHHAFKATTTFVDAFVNERLRQLLPSTNDCLLASSPWNILAEGRPLPPEILAPSDLYPLLEAASFDTFCIVAHQPQETEKEVQLHLTKTRQGLSNEPSTKVLRCP